MPKRWNPWRNRSADLPFGLVEAGEKATKEQHATALAMDHLDSTFDRLRVVNVKLGSVFIRSVDLGGGLLPITNRINCRFTS